MRVLSVVHGHLVGPELFGELIRARGHELVEWQIADASRAPIDADAVLVLGGHMNVGEERIYPWLELEYGLIREWVESETPLLGICLGAQTLARAFGAQVARAPARQAGFTEVSLTDAGRRDALTGVLPTRFPALFANAYSFSLPPGAVELVSTEAGPQAFRIGKRAWGLQFHPEARLGQVIAWWRTADDLPAPLPELERALAAGIEAWHMRGRALCSAFLDAATASVRRAQVAAAGNVSASS